MNLFLIPLNISAQGIAVALKINRVVDDNQIGKIAVEFPIHHLKDRITFKWDKHGSQHLRNDFGTLSVRPIIIMTVRHNAHSVVMIVDFKIDSTVQPVGKACLQLYRKTVDSFAAAYKQQEFITAPHFVELTLNEILH